MTGPGAGGSDPRTRTRAGEPEVDRQHDDRADDRTDPARRLHETVLAVVVEDQIAQKSAHERTDHADHDRAQDADVLLSGDDQPGDRSRDQTDDDQPDDGSEHDVPSCSASNDASAAELPDLVQPSHP